MWLCTVFDCTVAYPTVSVTAGPRVAAGRRVSVTTHGWALGLLWVSVRVGPQGARGRVAGQGAALLTWPFGLGCSAGTAEPTESCVESPPPTN